MGFSSLPQGPHARPAGTAGMKPGAQTARMDDYYALHPELLNAAYVDQMTGDSKSTLSHLDPALIASLQSAGMPPNGMHPLNPGMPPAPPSAMLPGPQPPDGGVPHDIGGGGGFARLRRSLGPPSTPGGFGGY